MIKLLGLIVLLSFMQMPVLASLKTDELENMLIREKFLQRAEEHGGKVAMREYLQREAISVKDIVETIKAEIAEEKLQQQFLSEEFTQKEISAAMARYYENRKNSIFTLPNRYYFSEIFISKKDKDTKSLEETINSLSLKLKEGEDFYLLANEFSDLKSARMLLPVMEDSQLYHPNIKEAVLNLLVIDELSPVIETETGFFILKLDDMHEAELLSFEQVKAKIYDEAAEEVIKSHFDEYKLKQLSN